MKPPNCINCAHNSYPQESRSKLVRFGRFYRTSDSTWVQRYRCPECKKAFSRTTFDNCYRQKKRHKNRELVGLLCSGVSQRRAAKLLNLNRKTVVRIFLIESLSAEFLLHASNLKAPPSTVIEFDDMETFEVTKCKPLSITLAVEHKTRRILSVEVSQMAANGRLASKARKLYGPRKDERRRGRRRLLRRVQDLVQARATIKSDQNPHYPKDVAKFFPFAKHERFKGKRGSQTGQGEIKKVKFDPLFSLNHTCAMLRANLNRLFRKTWCTTKRADRLYAHLVLYAAYHNHELILPKTPI